MNDLADFNEQLLADIQGDAEALGLVTVEAFFEKIGELLTEAGELDEAHRAYFEGGAINRPIQIDGYGGDPRDNAGLMNLILCDLDLGSEVRVQNTDHMKRLLQRLYRFAESSLKDEFRNEMEETSPGFGVADLISTTWKNIEKLKLIIVTNGDFRARADAATVKDLNGRPVTLSVWDIKRLKQYMEQGQSRANLTIDFEQDFGGGIPILKASGGSNSLESYLAVIPGSQLSAIYEKWGPRLLEANVRSFLQARGKVNKGIRDTIRDEPNMFFPYNNGLSVTADAIELEQKDLGFQLLRADNLQIVNGGQTTASLHAARKENMAELEEVFVQMKITIVPKEKSELVVPSISEYANSQNKVNAADFFANHPFHIRMEELSRHVLVRAEEGYRDTKWFYERARGQYADERGRKTVGERKRFDIEFPRSQFFTKTDLAKFENTWNCMPHIVSLGAQKNFAGFAKDIGKKWTSSNSIFNELWFKRMISKAIIFRTTEKLVSSADWYEGGYRANIVTYAIAKFVMDCEQNDMSLDLDTVWRNQTLSQDHKDVLSVAGAEAQFVITNPPAGVKNYSEWAKKQACWKQLEDRKLQYPDCIDRILISKDLLEERMRETLSEEAQETNIQVELQVYDLGASFWSEVRNWARERGLLSDKENSILEICSAMPKRIPSEKQCALAMKALNKLQEKGLKLQDFK